MSVLLAIVGVVLMAPVLLLVAIALGPAALVMVALIGSALLVVAVGEGVLRLTRRTRVPPLRG
ncbi:MAG: hypothetical protein ACXVII_34895 [Solirubrobacteraceae bacterium]